MAANVLIVKLSSLGDLLHALPAAHALKAGLNATRLDWVTQGEYREIVSCFTDVDEVIEFPRRNFLANFSAFRSKLRARRYDYVFDMQGLLKSGIVTWQADAARKIGPFGPREGARFFYNSYPTNGVQDRHAVDRLWDVVAHVGVEYSEKKFPLEFPEVKVEGSGPRVAIAPCSRWGAKNWPVDYFAELSAQLSGELGATVYIIGGPADRTVGDQISGASYNFCGEHRLPQTGNALQQMDVLVTNDSGPMHIAAAVGTPVVALFGPTDPGLTGPYGEQHMVLRSDEATEQGPGHLNFKSGDNSLMRQIRVDEVFAAVREVLMR